ncbi:MAG: flagellar hook-basal body complex protein FliE [Rhodobacterales bacterium]|jgi:flagellar hook-basal body complex protein FliE|nr:flagellar hook-basal body complex protein FliE [Rhodobacterales bacterium]MDX5389698.1 flagellar hook-basal body complex protein FliE [Rhodobacterales bacterium]MDX5489395.1 flagellar hook-basal body complex protein FliE [Rhodobacterales bacterium]
MDIRPVTAALGYAAARPATEPLPDPNEKFPTAAGVFQDFATTLREGEAVAKAAMTSGADPHSLVQALTQTELAVETAVTLRDRVVEAYQEILRMPV